MAQTAPLIQRLEKDYGLPTKAVVRDIQRYLKNFHEQKFLKACEFAADAHKGQLRKDGSPYITHPFETVRILVSLHVDEDTLIAAILHDVPEDTAHTIEEVEKLFGKKVASLVDGITKLSKVHYQNDMAKRQVESLKKLFIHTAEDPRIILIKLADRLHNMRTLQFIDKPEKRERIAKETLEIFVPIASLLGIEELKSELEDLCFRTLHPEEYEVLATRMADARKKNQPVAQETVELVEKTLKANRIEGTVYNRCRNLYSIYKRSASGEHPFSEFDHLVTFRVLVNHKEDCYAALGVIHSLFRPKPGKFKDYISVPKKNGYQSLHTSVFGLKQTVAEFQIRTNQMHLEAEYGITSQYFSHTSDQKTPHLEEDKRAEWAQKILAIQTSEASENSEFFMKNLKLDILHDRIFVFTPQGDSIDLPKEATCVDFAYQIHTQVGHRALRAEVNGEMLPVTTRLQNADTVNIITSDTPKGPERAWLGFVKTGTARGQIQEWFKKISRKDKISGGRLLLQKEMDRAGLGLLEKLPQKKIRSWLKKNLQYHTFDSALAAIGEGTLRPVDIINDMYSKITQRVLFRNQAFTKVTFRVVLADRVGQLRKVLNIFEEMGVNIKKTVAMAPTPNENNFTCTVTVLIRDFSQVSQIFEHLEQIEGVKRVTRLFQGRKVAFFLVSFFTFGIWATHPYMLYSLSQNFSQSSNQIISSAIIYLGIFMLFLMVFLLKGLTQRSFPELRETNGFWGLMYLLNVFALITVLAEIYIFQITSSWPLLLGLLLFVSTYLTAEYLRYRNRE